MLYCVTDGDDHIEPLRPQQVKAGKGMLDGSPDCVIKMLPHQVSWFESDSTWAPYKDRFLPCIIQPGDEGVKRALKEWRYYTPSSDPYYWDGYVDLSRVAEQGFDKLNTRFIGFWSHINSFADFKQFEVVGLDSVGSRWFIGCKKMSNIALPSTIKSINRSAFYDCVALTEIELPAAVSNIGTDAFKNCTGLKSIIVRNKVPATLGEEAFPKNEGMKIRVPVESLNDYLTAWAEYKDYIVGDDFKHVKKAGTLADELGLTVEWSFSGPVAFDEPRYLHGNYGSYDSLTVSGPLNNLDLVVLRYLAGCDSYERGHRYTDGRLRYLNLYDASFVDDKNCNAHYINMGDQSKGRTFGWHSISADNELPHHAFTQCRVLETIILPKSITYMGTNVFTGCTSLKQVAFTGKVDTYDGWQYYTKELDNPLQELVFYTDGVAKSTANDPWGQDIGAIYTKKSQIDEYLSHYYLTRRCSSITALFNDDAAMVTLADHGEFFPSVYMSKENLGGIFHYSNIENFDDFALFNKVKVLDNTFFGNYELQRITLQASVTKICRAAFNNCLRLDTITMTSDSVPELELHAFEYLPKDFRIIVPRHVVKVYREKWAEYADHIYPEDAYQGNDTIITITLEKPNTLAEKLGLTPSWDTHTMKMDSGTPVWFITALEGLTSHIRRLKVNGPISGSDLAVLRHLSGYTPWGDCRNYMASLEYIDLYDANLVKSYHDAASDMY